MLIAIVFLIGIPLMIMTVPKLESLDPNIQVKDMCPKNALCEIYGNYGKKVSCRMKWNCPIALSKFLTGKQRFIEFSPPYAQGECDYSGNILYIEYYETSNSI